MRSKERKDICMMFDTRPPKISINLINPTRYDISKLPTTMTFLNCLDRGD
jgi:hypothetical protein